MPETAGAWLDTVRRIVAAVRASDVTELQLEHGSFRVRVVRDPASAAVAATATLLDGSETGPASHLHKVLAPFTGVFYRAPTPSARPYLTDGEWVDADGVVGLIETMKIFNEVTADRPGRVASFQAESGQLVHAGDALVLLEPAERSAAAPEPAL